MQKIKNKTIAIMIAIFLTLSMSASMILLPNANAHTPAWTIPTFAYIQAAPDTIGVGQTTYIYAWLDKPLPNTAMTNDIRFHNYQVIITAPDGAKETKTFPIVQDTTSSQGFSYTPTQVGTYNLSFTFPGQVYTWAGDYQNDTYAASSSSTTLTVQQEPIVAYPDSYPFPTEFWSRPIYAENPYWYTISSNWLGTGSPDHLLGRGGTRFASDWVGSLTSHVMWTKSLQSGGVVGGNKFVIAGDTYFDGSAYIQRYINPIILNGKLYYTEPVSFAGSAGNFGGASYGPTDCVDLQTGELIWSRSDVPALSFGYIYDFQDPQQHGVAQPIIVASNLIGITAFFGGAENWMGYDADTGDWLFNATNIPSGAIAMGPQGETLKYTITNCGTLANPKYYLGEWNSSQMGWTDNSGGFGFGNFGALLGVFDATKSTNYDWNISLPWLTTMPTVIAGWYNDVMLCYSGSLPTVGSSDPYTYFAINLNASKGAVGSRLWTNTVAPPTGNITVTQGGVDPVGRVFLEGYKETMQWVAYNMDTGAKLWGPVGNQAGLDYYGIPGTEDRLCQIAYGKCYSAEFSGIIYCYDEKTGNLLWTFGNGGAGNSTQSGFQVPGNYPTAIDAIANGVIYTISTEHTIQTPLYKGAMQRAINATDGTEIWAISGYTGEFFDKSYALADGYNTWFNSYDNKIYVVGRGVSANTVDAPMADITLGSGLVIRGTVTDISAGTKQKQQAADFPNGVACASDASMTEWMAYVYQQKPLPSDFTGVSVTINVVDANGNFRSIGTAKTDANGAYSLQWTPDIPGKYTVISSFDGTNGYWPSSAEISFAVDAVAATPEPTTTPQTDIATNGSLMTAMAIGVIAIIIAIAIVGFLILRKRP